MAVARIVLVSILAAIAGCALSSWLLFGSIERASLAPLVFALPASLLLLATTYAAMAERGRAMIWRYVVLIIEGAVAGGFLLGYISAGKDTTTGSLYGVMTALSWIVLHSITRPRTRRVVAR